MAVVYRVRDTRDGSSSRSSAASRATAASAKRNEALFEREYHTLAQLAHPRIIEVYDYGVDEHGPYYTMELLDGSDLDQRGQLPWREACALLRDVASSLAILHARGLVHRDVSDAQRALHADGRAKLIDFGAMTSMGVAEGGRRHAAVHGARGRCSCSARRARRSVLARRARLLPADRQPRVSGAPLRAICATSWRSSPHRPSRRVRRTCRTHSSELVMELLGARPQRAAAQRRRGDGAPVHDRRAPAGRARGVSRAYLATPTLVGRERALVAVRKRLLSLARGDGGALLIEGEPGSGRSRLLDACALEAKLLGAAVLRADAATRDAATSASCARSAASCSR